MDKIKQIVVNIDRWLKKAIGQENELLFHFVRLTLVTVVFALAVGAVVEIVALIFHAVSFLFALLVAALPYLAALAVAAGIVALVVYVRRFRQSRRRREAEKEDALQQQAQQWQRAKAAEIQDAVRAADPRTRSDLETVLASLRRFNHRLEIPITPLLYNELLGENWVNVKEFAESPQGRGVHEASALLVEIIILYKRAEEVRWLPVNFAQMHAWWAEAAGKRTWLSDVLQAAGAATAAGEVVSGAAVSDGPKAVPRPATSIPPPAAPKLSAPPTLAELQRYYEWINRKN